MAKVEKAQGQDTRLPLWAQNKERRRAKQEERSRILQWKAEIDHAMRMDEERAERRARALAREAAERKEAKASRTFAASARRQQLGEVGADTHFLSRRVRKAGAVAWDMADSEPVRPQWPWTDEEKAQRAAQEDLSLIHI